MDGWSKSLVLRENSFKETIKCCRLQMLTESSDQFQINIRQTSSGDVTGQSGDSCPEIEKPGFVGSRVPVRACSFWWSQGIVVPSMLVPQSVDWNSSEEALIPHSQAKLQVLLVPLTSSDLAAFHQKWCESCLSMHQMTFPWFWLVTSFDFCSQICNCSKYFTSPV